jgi:hypothetical protein
MGVPTSTGSEPKDPIDDYDRSHGTTTLADEQKATGLNEGSNKEPPQYNPIKGAK